VKVCENGWIVVEILQEKSKALFKGGRLSVANDHSFYIKIKEGWQRGLVLS